MAKIRHIFGVEPRREGEYPDGYTIKTNGVTRIEPREQNLGEYGIQWFDIFKGDMIYASMNAMHVAHIIYEEE